ncbi:MAG: T9SS type A sorting domain-containing protein [Bacteroidetes bacterium]|nr:T9SS type A sorting domain-containing protein [Bacteroidota bacterium]
MPAYNWTLPPGAIVTSSSSTSNSITFKASNVSWCGDIVVEPVNACSAGGSSSIPVCIGNSISTLTPATAMCAGSNNMVPFIASGSFNSGNVFTAQLSDANGDFSSPVNIGTYSSTGSGVMHTTIPASTPYGTGYRIRVVNSNPAGIGSPNPDDITISHPSAVVNSTTNVLCFNGLTGAADVNVTDGQAPYSYDWEPGNPTGDGSSAVSSLAAGSYTCTVTDVLGCSSTATLNITQPDELIVSATQTSPILCNGGLANIDVTAAGGAGGYAGTGSFTVSAGSYSYTVTDGNSCSSSALITVTEPTLLTASYTAGQINCFGGTASVVVSAAGGTTPYSGDGSFSQYAGTISYPITDANGCTTSVTVALTEPSKVEGTIATTPTGCLGNDGTATITPSGGTGPYTYLWSDGQTTQTATGLISANYSVVITDGNGCTGAASAMVGASTGLLPAPGVIAGATSGVCRNTSGLVYSVAPVAGAVSYAWTLPNGATGVSNTNSITLSFTNAYAGGFLCVSAVNACGLGAASCVSIPVYATYASTPAPITGPSIVCGPGVYTFSTSSTNASGYNWTASGTGVSIQSGQGTNTVQVSISSGFISGSLQVSASNCYGNSAVRGMLLYGIPTNMNPITGNIFVCPGGTTTFAMNLVPGITSYSWSISGDATLVTSSQNATQTTATFAMGSAWTTGSVTLTVANSCGSYSRSFSVFSVPGQPGSITGPNTGLCGLSNVTYSILAVPGATSYSWTVPAGVSIVNNTGLSITVNYTAAFTGSGSICVVPNNSCGSGPARCYGITSRLSIPTITGPASVCKSQSAVAYSATPIAGALSYTWSVTGGGTITPAGTSATVNFNTTTSSPATVRVNANNACGASQPGIYNVSVNLACREAQELNTVSDFESSVTLFPNPTSGKADLSFGLNRNLKVEFKITDIYGKMISQEEINAVEGLNHHNTDLSNCAKGVYLLTLITSDGESRTMRLIVE